MGPREDKEYFMKRIERLVSVVLILTLATSLVSMTGCVVSQQGSSVAATDLMSDVTPNRVAGKPADAAFRQNMADFSFELFERSIAAEDNSLISPLSVMLALSMTANGAKKETLAQMEELLGGTIPLNELNEYLYAYINGLPSSEDAQLSIANSIWFRNDGETLQVNPDFLQTNADYYGASIYGAAFDDQTLKDINNWVSLQTNGMINEIIKEIKELSMLYLINAVAFDAQWQKVYNKENISEGEFTDIHGAVQQVDFMFSKESLYLNDGQATGFMKPYADGTYSFVAILPNENVSLNDYIRSLNGTGFLNMLENAVHTEVRASMPKFEFEYEKTMNAVLAQMGMPDAFDPYAADFSGMAATQMGNLYISEVLHKTYISVDELGTRAGAVTSVSINTASAALSEPKIVRLDRPFVFAIVDNATNLPLFIGTVTTIG